MRHVLEERKKSCFPSHSSGYIIFLVIFVLLAFSLVCTTDALDTNTLKDISVNASCIAETARRDLANLTSTLLLLTHDDTLSTNTRHRLQQEVSSILLRVESFTRDICIGIGEQEFITTSNSSSGSSSNSIITNKVPVVEKTSQMESKLHEELSFLCHLARRRLRRWDAKLTEILGSN
ncbi:hypothetical protein LSM04_006265 [Trypanosoma melophagium]|uniref:uncharacterized protein n=1 Tax=Trypanosoma melophagium TaxID=715481 RepID=UPI00351A0287|nr:hypothetical protein LSM04_006265 [Trypanosoma melophagium]